MLAKFLFVVLLAMCVIVGGTLLLDEAPNSHGVDHAVFKDMKQGGSGPQRHGGIRWLGLAFAGLQIMFFVGCLRLGLNAQSRCTKALLLSGLAYVAVLAGMVIADRQYAQADTSALLLCFPAPTALMLYGLYTVPLTFTLLYVVYYDRWIVRPEDLQRFRETLKAKKRSESDS